MKSTILIENMEFYAYHGCFEEEQAIGTHFLVDVAFEQDSSRAIKTDDLHDTVNYLSVYQSVKKEMHINSKLIEHVAYRVMSRLLREFEEMESVNITIKKMNPPLGGKMRYVAVKMQLDRANL